MEETTGIPAGYTEEDWEGLSETEREGIREGLKEDEEMDSDISDDDLAKVAGEEAESDTKTEAVETKQVENKTETATGKEVGGIDTEISATDQETVRKQPASTEDVITDEELLRYHPIIDERALPKMGEETVSPALQSKLSDLQAKFDAQEIPLADYISQRDTINRQIFRENAQAHQEVTANERTRLVSEKYQDAFFSARPEYRENTTRGEMLFAALDSAIKGIVADPKNAGKSQMAIMLEGDKIVHETFGLPARGKAKPTYTGNDASGKPAARIPDEKTLADIPTAEKNESGDWMTAGDKLKGEAFEKWFERLTEDQRDAYLARA